MKIVLTGSSGNLGLELQKINSEILCPKHGEVDVDSYAQVFSYLHHVKPDVVIHAAAVTDNRIVEKNPVSAIQTNIIGTANIAILCYQMGIRLIYLSTDYVYASEHGNFTEKDPLLPFNKYAYSKLGGECSVVMVKNHLIIRTSFGKNEFPYQEAFVDKWTSKDYVDRIAPLIYEAALSPLTGVLNIGTERKTLYSHAVERKPDVNGVKVAETNYFTPVDTSLNLQKWINYKSSKSMARPHKKCRICGSENLKKYLDLGLMPLANNLEFTAQRAKEAERFPLQVMFCERCGLSQLSVVIDADKMFSHYLYRSSINKPYIQHCRNMAKSLRSDYRLNAESFHIDIAGNDGALLKEFKEEIGLRVLNVDPASNLVAIAEAQGIDSIADFWSMEVAEKIEKKYGRADLITATNVIAHVDKVNDFINAARSVLKKSGIIVIECPYLVPFIENMEWPTLYFEHISTMSVMPMFDLCKQNGLKIINIQPFDIHCGTIRVTISHETSDYQVGPSVPHYMATELKGGYNKFETYADWSEDVKKMTSEFETNLLQLKKEGYKIAAYGASAKSNSLLNYANMNTDIISWIADSTPEKIGKFSPGTGIPVVHTSMIEKDAPDYLIIGAWNFEETMIENARKLGYKGKYIIPIPSWRIVE